MSLWIELHCDILASGPHDPTRLENFCYTERGDSVGILVDNHAIKLGRDQLILDALKLGWEKRGHRWACPNCKTVTSIRQKSKKQ